MSSSISRILYRTFCTSLSTTTPKPTSSPTLKTLLNDLFAERNLNHLVEKFKKSSESYRFRCKHRVYEVTVRRLASAKRFESIEEILELQKKFRDISDEGFAIRLITLYGKSGMFDHASKTFEEMPDLKCDRTVKSFNALLNACVDSKNHEKVPTLFQEFQSNKSIKPDLYTYNIVVRSYCEMGSLDSALSVLDEMEKNEVKPNVITYNTLLNAFYGKGRFSDGEKIWARMKENDVVPDVRSYNSKLRGLIVDGKTEEAVKLVEELKSGEDVKPDIFSYNSLIKGYCNDGKLEEAKKIFDDLTKNECAPNRMTFDTLIPAVCEKEDFDLALELCKDSIGRRCFVNAEILQVVVDGLFKQLKPKQAKFLVKLAKAKSYGHSTITMPTKEE